MTRSNNGTTVTLTCYADTDSSITAPTISWYLDGSVTPSTNSSSNDTYVISELEIAVSWRGFV